MKMTVGEFFEKCCAGFAPGIIDAIPVEWLMDMANRGDFVYGAVARWQMEQEAQDE